MSSTASPAVDFPLTELAWINRFFGNLKDFLFLREEDSLLILPPNRVYKLNPSGLEVLRHLHRGRDIESFPSLRPGDRARDTNLFFSNLKALYEDRITDTGKALAVESVPFDFDFTLLPVLGEIALTYRCNNRCLFCYASCGNPEQGGFFQGSAGSRTGFDGGVSGRQGELTTGQARRIIRIFKEKAKVPFFSFTGGEPLMRRDLETLIAFSARLGLRTNLISNGTLATPDRARRLARSGLRTAQISLESPDPAVHDGLTGVPGSWVRTLAGIHSLRDAGISVQTNTTLTRANEPSFTDLPGFLAENGIRRFAMNLFIPTERNGQSTELFFPYSRVGEIIEAVRREARRGGQVFYWYSPVPHCLYNPLARGLGNKSCAAMDGLLSVSPRGDVLPCSSYPESLGSLLTEDFDTVWFSGRARYFKQKRYAPPECRGCGRFAACQSACPLYWRFAGTGEIRNPARCGRRKT